MARKYRTMAAVEWQCNRCGEEVMEDVDGNGRCGCTKSPSPWEPIRVLNGDGTSEFILFGRGFR
jgi:hypothetical protein